MTATYEETFQNAQTLMKSAIIEMSEARNDLKIRNPSLKSSNFQPNEIPYIQSEIQLSDQFQGSILSLASRSCIDQSDVQPLTALHACNYGECLKGQLIKNNNETIESPFSSIKNFLLYLVIFLLILWIIIYSILSQLSII